MELLQVFVAIRVYLEAYKQDWNADSDKLVGRCMWRGGVPIECAYQVCLSGVPIKCAYHVCLSGVPIKCAYQVCLSSVPITLTLLIVQQSEREQLIF
jgi:hypothetical protein